MLKADFRDAEAKLERADEHIAELQRIILSFLQSDFYRVSLQPDYFARRARLVFDSLHQPSKRLNVVLGDAISCIRSSLDYTINAALFPVTRTYEEAGFPFKDHPNDLKSTVEKGPIAQLGPAIGALILDEIQAKKGGACEALWILNKLRNIDKHRLLIATVELAAVRVSLQIGNISMHDCLFGATPGERSVVLDAPIGGELHLASQPRTVFEVRLNEPPHIEHVEMLGFLREAANQAGRVLQAFKVALG